MASSIECVAPVSGYDRLGLHAAKHPAAHQANRGGEGYGRVFPIRRLIAELYLMDCLHCQPRFASNDAEERSRRSGRTATVLLPVLRCLYADATPGGGNDRL